MSALQWLSTAALPLFIVLTLAFSFAKKRDPYEAFLEGAKGGAKIVFQTMPYVVAMVFAVKIFQASGLFDWVGRLLAFAGAAWNSNGGGAHCGTAPLFRGRKPWALGRRACGIRGG